MKRGLEIQQFRDCIKQTLCMERERGGREGGDRRAELQVSRVSHPGENRSFKGRSIREEAVREAAGLTPRLLSSSA